MSENYKITKEIAMRIIELKIDDGISFTDISKKLKSEFGKDISRSAVSRFFSNYLKGVSKILPANIQNLEMNITNSKSQPVNTTKANKKAIVEKTKAITNSNEDNALLNQLSDGKSLNKATKPSDDFFDLYKPKNK